MRPFLCLLQGGPLCSFKSTGKWTRPWLFEGGNERAPALALSLKGRLSRGDFKSKGKREGPPLCSFTPKGGGPVSSFVLQKGAPWIGQKCRESPKVKGKGATSLLLQGRGGTRPLLCVLEGRFNPWVLAKVKGRARAIVLSKEMKDPTCLCLSTGGPPHLFF